MRLGRTSYTRFPSESAPDFDVVTVKMQAVLGSKDSEREVTETLKSRARDRLGNVEPKMVATTTQMVGDTLELSMVATVATSRGKARLQ